MAIHLLTGLPGSSKTVALTAKALEYLEEGNADVYANFYIETDSPRFHFWSRLSDLVRIREGVIFLDEAQIYFNSRAWTKLPLRLQYKLQQHRKQGLHIWAACQNINRIDVSMRELITNYYECKRMFVMPFSKNGWSIYRISEYDPSDAKRVRRERLDRRWYIGRTRKEERPAQLPKKLWPAYGRYDTLREVDVPDDVRYDPDATYADTTNPLKLKKFFQKLST